MNFTFIHNSQFVSCSVIFGDSSEQNLPINVTVEITRNVMVQYKTISKMFGKVVDTIGRFSCEG